MTSNIARYIALPIVSAGMANAATQTQPTGPGYSYAPVVKATTV